MTHIQKNLVKVAVIQASPVLFNCLETTNKVCRLSEEAAEKGAELVLFPEAFIPAYPRGLGFGMVVGSRDEKGRELFQLYYDQSVTIPGKTTEQLSKAALKNRIYLVIGIIEREAGTLYCTTLYFGPDGTLLGKHRKLKPTAAERMIWGEGDGSTLTVLDTDIGKIGGLTCWENYMPMARMAMYNKGVDIYLAPTADSRDTWQSTIRHIACEGRCYVLGCNQYVTKSMYPEHLQQDPDLSPLPEVMCRGGSAIVSPMGDIIAGPLFDEEGILYAELDRQEIVRGKLDFDVSGHYARPDIFTLSVNEREMKPVVPMHSK